MGTRLNKTTIDRLKPRKSEYFTWDAQMPNFGVRVYPTGRKVYVIQYRVGSETRRYKLGPHGHLTVQQARKEAQVKLGEVAKGGDPSKERQQNNKRPTLSSVCDEYLELGCGHKKESTINSDKYRLERHIRPLLGRRKIDAITKADVVKFVNQVALGYEPRNVKTKPRGRAVFKGGGGTANRTRQLLGAIFTFAIQQGYCSSNPVHGIKKFKEGKRERFLSDDEYVRIGKAVRELETKGANPLALKALRLLMLSGCRKSEITNLRWENVDWANRNLQLPDTKTGYRNIPMSEEGMQMLKELREGAVSDDWVFPNAVGGPLKDLRKTWLAVLQEAELEDVRIHDLRHSFASAAMREGVSLFEVGKILGHKCQETTARYAHLSDEAVSRATNVTAQRIIRALG